MRSPSPSSPTLLRDSTPRRGPPLGSQRVRLGRHDEVVPVEAADLVGPPGHRDSPPLGEESGMVALLFRESPNAVG
jgi:hypothetical protein